MASTDDGIMDESPGGHESAAQKAKETVSDNIVTIHTAQDGKWIDDTEDVYVTDGSLCRELERINSYTDMGTL